LSDAKIPLVERFAAPLASSSSELASLPLLGLIAAERRA
jgi:hypothetical protein